MMRAGKFFHFMSHFSHILINANLNCEPSLNIYAFGSLMYNVFNKVNIVFHPVSAFRSTAHFSITELCYMIIDFYNTSALNEHEIDV